MPSHLGGVYRGIVRDNADPQRRRRVRVIVPRVLGDQVLPWARPCQPPGVTSVPAVGKPVWIMFEEGHVKDPVWLGVWDGQLGTFAGTLLGDHFGASVGSHLSGTVTYELDDSDARVSATTGTTTGYSLSAHAH